MRIKNLPSIESMDGSQDALVIEQTDGSEDKSRKVSPAQLKQYVLGEVDEVPTEDSDNLVKSGGVFSTMAVAKYNSATETEYFEGGSAFEGNIDSVPTAGSNNAVASGGTKTYVDNAINTALDNSKIATLLQTFRDLSINSAWGSLYITQLLTFDISSLGLRSAPKTVSLTVLDQGATVIIVIDKFTASSIKFYISRPAALTGVTVHISALVVY